MIAVSPPIFRPSGPRFLPAMMLAGLMILTACGSEAPQISPVPPPPARPERPETASQAEIRKARAERNRAVNQAAASAAARASERSLAQRGHYAQVERELLKQNRLRRDRVPQDAPIDAETLTRNFMTVALRDEYGADGSHAGPDGLPAPLRRWRDPVRLQLEFGASANQPLRGIVLGEVTAYAARLAEITRHPVSVTSRGGNFAVLVLTDDERRDIAPRLAELGPGIPAADVDTIQHLSQENTCIVFAYSQGSNPTYAHAVALIRAELPSLLRSSCIHEEIAQGLGLANDSLTVRPSIFNDDEEFALLTRHDELLLQILYDPRLRPGMTEAEARPIVRRIAAELLGENV